MAREGFKRHRRLTIAREFDAVFSTASYRVSSNFFTVLAMENGVSDSRVGTVVNKKVARNSVNRNRIRRLIKEAFRRRFSLHGLDVVVVARSPAGRGENTLLTQALLRLWDDVHKSRQSALST
jgi:ribonuclease P protein component